MNFFRMALGNGLEKYNGFSIDMLKVNFSLLKLKLRFHPFYFRGVWERVNWRTENVDFISYCLWTGHNNGEKRERMKLIVEEVFSKLLNLIPPPLERVYLHTEMKKKMLSAWPSSGFDRTSIEIFFEHMKNPISIRPLSSCI